MIPTGQTAAVLAVKGDWLDLLLYGTCLAVALLAAAAVIELVRRWRRKGDKTPAPGDELANYRALYKRGEISQEEFDHLRAVLGGEHRPPAAPKAPPPAPSPNPTNGQPPGDGPGPK